MDFPTLIGRISRLGRKWQVMPQHPALAPAAQGSSLVQCSVFEDGKQRTVSLSEAHEVIESGDSGFAWLELHEPGIEQLTGIAERLDLHPLAVEDAVHAHQRPKIEEYEGGLFAVLKTVRYVDREEVLNTGEVMAFLGPRFVVTVSHGADGGLARVRDGLTQRAGEVTMRPTTVLWAVADHIVDEYAIALDGLGEDVEEVEAAVFDATVATPTERIYKLKREVLEFRRAIEPLDRALALIVDSKTSIVDERTVAYFRDVQDHAIRHESRLNTFDQLLSDVLQANVALVTLALNEDVRKISAWAAILASVTAVAGIYGMNFENMPELRWANGYFICLGVLATLAVGLYVLFRHRRWL